MALPRSPEARQFLQSARQRLRDAEILLEAGRMTGAVYLAGYAVEGALKALWLDASPRGKRKEVMASFRMAKAHDFDWLRTGYAKVGGFVIPPPVARRFVEVRSWDTSMRYQSASLEKRDAVLFFGAAKAILEWAEGRF